MSTRKKKAPPKNFKAAYSILKTNAEALQQTSEPDIDNLMTTVEQSIEAYKICQARIKAVQQALDAAFDEDNEEVENDVEVVDVEEVIVNDANEPSVNSTDESEVDSLEVDDEDVDDLDVDS